MRRNHRDDRDDRGDALAEISASYEIHMSDSEFDMWLSLIAEENLRTLEQLFEQQLRFFQGVDCDHRRAGRRTREDVSIGRIISMTKELQLEMCDLAHLQTRLRMGITVSGLESASRTLRNHW